MQNKMTTIKFCKSKCCPVVKIEEDKVLLGDKDGPEGVTTWTKNQFNDFIEAVKEGKFDEAIKK